MSNLYYVAPKDEIFEETKEKAIEVWEEVGDHPSYVREKVARIKEIENIRDNFMCIVAMFDSGNQYKLFEKVSPEAKKEISNRLNN